MACTGIIASLFGVNRFSAVEGGLPGRMLRMLSVLTIYISFSIYFYFKYVLLCPFKDVFSASSIVPGTKVLFIRLPKGLLHSLKLVICSALACAATPKFFARFNFWRYRDCNDPGRD